MNVEARQKIMSQATKHTLSSSTITWQKSERDARYKYLHGIAPRDRNTFQIKFLTGSNRNKKTR